MNQEYTCPMHPQIRQSKPGACPICGMALEARVYEEKNPELAWMSRRFWIALALTLPIIILSSFDKYWGIQAILASLVVFCCGYFFFLRGWRRLNMFSLISLGVASAYIYSIVSFFRHGQYVYFEAAAVITTLVLLGQVLELQARSKTSQAIKQLLNLRPATATLISQDRREKTIPLEEVKRGDILRVRPGDKIPVDGVILEGSAVIDESLMTGESIPIDKKESDQVIGGTLNQSGSFLMIAQKVGSETVLARIVQLVSEAQRSRAPIQNLADRVSAYFIPVVIVIALITWATFGLINAVSVLIIACPCALGLATPMSIMVGIGKGATQGILIKNAESLEKMSQIDTLVIDKTGTITEGKIKVTEFTDKQLLQLVASIEIMSEHPIAKSIVSKAQQEGLSLLKVENFKSLPGKGVRGAIEKREILIGTQKLMEGIDFNPFLHQAEALRQNGQTVLYVAVDKRPAGLIAVADSIKDSSYQALQELKNMTIIMATGDNRMTAQAIGKKLGIERIEPEVLPEDKNKLIKQLQANGHKVAMAGDGINDAPALAEADVGIAMGTGSDIAIESADITLVKGDLRSIAKVRNLSLATVKNIHQNLWFAFIYNAIGVPLATGFFGITLNPMIASAAMALSSVSVVYNALRLRHAKL